MLRIGALISGGGTNATAIIDACMEKSVDGDVVVVGSDNPAADGLRKAATRGIETFVVDYGAIMETARSGSQPVAAPADFQVEEALSKLPLFAGGDGPDEVARRLAVRAAAEAQLLKHLRPFAVDLLVLAGFMRVLSPYFIDRFNTDPEIPRIMNIHPALLPAFPGVDGYGDTFRYGCKVAGCTVHFIDYGEDTGPIIGQRAFSIEENDTLESVRKKGLAQEWRLYPACIQQFAEGRLKVEDAVYEVAPGKTFRRKHVRILPPPALSE